MQVFACFVSISFVSSVLGCDSLNGVKVGFRKSCVLFVTWVSVVLFCCLWRRYKAWEFLHRE